MAHECRSQRINVGFEYATKIDWHPTDDARIYALMLASRNIETLAVPADSATKRDRRTAGKVKVCQ